MARPWRCDSASVRTSARKGRPRCKTQRTCLSSAIFTLLGGACAVPRAPRQQKRCPGESQSVLGGRDFTLPIARPQMAAARWDALDAPIAQARQEDPSRIRRLARHAVARPNGAYPGPRYSPSGVVPQARLLRTECGLPVASPGAGGQLVISLYPCVPPSTIARLADWQSSRAD